MNKYKVCVYAICKNESKFVEKWVESMKEADEIYVLDTGSEDNTVELLENLGVNVSIKKFSPWRFDNARNESLNLIPEDFDICVCTDLDELLEPGWRSKLEEHWNKGINRLAYNYNWSFDKNGNPAVNFYIEKIHSRKDFTWVHPVHEVLKYIGDKKEIKIYVDDITVNHYPDTTKSRSNYLSLLELSVREDPDDDRNMHYLGREYMYYKKWNKAIDTLIRHLKLPSSTWKEERCASMRFISRCYIALKRYDEAEMWLFKAVNECPNIREGFTELGMLYYQNKDYLKAKACFDAALKLEEVNKIYINEPFCYDGTIYDYLSICEYYLGNYKEAVKYVKRALKFDKNSKRLKENLSLFSQSNK